MGVSFIGQRCPWCVLVTLEANAGHIWVPVMAEKKTFQEQPKSSEKLLKLHIWCTCVKPKNNKQFLMKNLICLFHLSLFYYTLPELEFRGKIHKTIGLVACYWTQTVFTMTHINENNKTKTIFYIHCIFKQVLRHMSRFISFGFFLEFKYVDTSWNRIKRYFIRLEVNIHNTSITQNEVFLLNWKTQDRQTCQVMSLLAQG